MMAVQPLDPQHTLLRQLAVATYKKNKTKKAWYKDGTLTQNTDMEWKQLQSEKTKWKWEKVGEETKVLRGRQQSSVHVETHCGMRGINSTERVCRMFVSWLVQQETASVCFVWVANGTKPPTSRYLWDDTVRGANTAGHVVCLSVCMCVSDLFSLGILSPENVKHHALWLRQKECESWGQNLWVSGRCKNPQICAESKKISFAHLNL